MRLSADEIDQIKKVARSTFGDDTDVFLFGSRLSHTRRGGDIDLLVRSSKADNLLQAKIRFLAELKSLIGDQKIDVIIRSKTPPNPTDIIYKQALEGEKL